MKSMTGFGRAVLALNSADITIDISSVNRKGLEVGCSLPREWAGAERLFAGKVREFFTRGKVSVSVRTGANNKSTAFCFDESAAAGALQKMRGACEAAAVAFEPNFDSVLKICLELSKNSAASAAADFEGGLWPKIEPALMLALKNIDEMRKAEGAALARDFSARLKTLQSFVDSIKEASKTTVSEYKNALLARLKSLNLELDLDDERVLKELSIFADKCDISEEITRLESHISQFLSCVNSGEILGRKMDFICQEMGREINTIGSKANNLRLTKIVIDFKNELERVREQTQNVE